MGVRRDDAGLAWELLVVVAGWLRLRRASTTPWGLVLVASRVNMRVHYPTDGWEGWTAGLARLLICWLVARARLWSETRSTQLELVHRKF